MIHVTVKGQAAPEIRRSRVRWNRKGSALKATLID